MFRLIWFHKKYWGVVICQCANRNFKLMEQWRRMSLTDWRRKANLKKTHFTTRNNGRTPILKKGKIQHVIALYSFSYWAAFKRLFVYYQLANTTNQYNLTRKVLHVGINICRTFDHNTSSCFLLKQCTYWLLSHALDGLCSKLLKTYAIMHTSSSFLPDT